MCYATPQSAPAGFQPMRGEIVGSRSSPNARLDQSQIDVTPLGITFFLLNCARRGGCIYRRHRCIASASDIELAVRRQSWQRPFRFECSPECTTKATAYTNLGRGNLSPCAKQRISRGRQWRRTVNGSYKTLSFAWESEGRERTICWRKKRSVTNGDEAPTSDTNA